MTAPAAASIAAVLLLSGCGSTDGAESCAEPQLVVVPILVAPGDDVRLAAGGLFDGCYDGGESGAPPPYTDVEFRLVTSGRSPKTFVLATLDADDHGTINAAVRVPDHVPPGPAHIEGDLMEPVAVEVTTPGTHPH
jgi:hypothetical protein